MEIVSPRHRLRESLSLRAWSNTLSIRSFDVALSVRVSDEAVMPDVMECLPPGWVTDVTSAGPSSRPFSVALGRPSRRTGRCRVHVYDDAERIVRSDDHPAAMFALESALRFSVASSHSPWLFVHAGVVGWRGRAIVIPGVSGAGKTRLVKALVEAGATYYSDEYAVLDEAGLVWPFPKPLSIRLETFPWRSRLPVSALGGTIGQAPLPIGLVAETRYRPGAEWQPAALTPAAAAMALLAHTVRARSDPAGVLSRLKQALSAASGVMSERGDAARTAAAMLDGTVDWNPDSKTRRPDA